MALNPPPKDIKAEIIHLLATCTERETKQEELELTVCRQSDEGLL